jgi:hypothetical protein
LHLPWNTRTAYFLGPGHPPPEQLQALTLPVDHSVCLDENQGVGPVAPDLAEEHPEYPIRRSQSGSGVLLLENGQLLAQGEVLDH